MFRRIRTLLIALIAAVTFVGNVQSANALDITTTIMLYICGTDLQAAAVENLYAMASVDIPDNVNLVVWAGGAYEWDDEDLQPKAITSFQVEYQAFSNLRVMGSKSMGDSDTLYSFMKYAAQNYPADRYGLVLWDHGGGATGGICYDETYNHDMLTMPEVYNALYRFIEQDGSPRFDFIGCDACLMASYEMAANLRYFADYFVGSEELEPGCGWGYDIWLSIFCADPNMSTERLCKVIADGFYETCALVAPDDYVTQSVIYLPAMGQLIEYMDQFSGYLAQALENGELATFSRTRARLFEFGSFYDSSSDMVDLAQMVSAFSSYAPKTAANVLAALNRAVKYTRNGAGFEEACGLSILLPKTTLSYFHDYYRSYPDIAVGQYADFVRGYAELLLGGSYVFTAHAPAQMDAESMTSAAFTGSFANALFPTGGYVADETDVEEIELTADEEATPFPSVWSFQPQGSSAPVETASEENFYAYSMQLTQDDIANLSYVEGMLLMDISDEEIEAYVDLGYLQNAWVDWESGMVYSQFDGMWSMLEDQLVPLYEQSVNQITRRCLIPVNVNSESCYLVVIFDPQTPDGRIAGYSEGINDQGLPARGITPLKEGDEITPLYTLYYTDEDGETQETEFEGDPITMDANGLDFSFISLEDTDTTYLYCFCLNNIYGDYTFSDFIAFEL